jgi:hypothetical protein
MFKRHRSAPKRRRCAALLVLLLRLLSRKVPAAPGDSDGAVRVHGSTVWRLIGDVNPPRRAGNSARLGLRKRHGFSNQGRVISIFAHGLIRSRLAVWVYASKSACE